MTSKRDFLTQKQQELDDLKRLIEILDKVEILTVDMSVENVIAVSPQVHALSTEADRILRKHKDVLPSDLIEYAENYRKVFTVFTEIYHVETELRRDVNRLIRLETRKQVREVREAAIHNKPTTCAVEGCKKPVRVYANELAYCKRHAREEGIILRGKIV